ncbi:immunoglobulin domain-containing protein [Pontibacter ummariensis]|uniref:immunoglobulin domain-containing protein n=1 Tax=Pontibacter ummariensis TaxID=1610492 RepID=UPI000B785DA4|nr:hypothetical protein [Pontibacter ummariensis]
MVSNVTKESGTTFYMEFPPVVKDGKFFKNSSPKLTPPPSDYACQGELFSYDFGSSDADGDHLVYDMVSPLNGYSTPTNHRPPVSSGPYPEVNWLPGYNQENQILGDPVVNVDKATGWLTVKPKYSGLFTFSVRVQDFRNGVKIGEVRRDFQLLVKACPRNDAPEVTVIQSGNLTPYSAGQTLRISPEDARCIKIVYTDPDQNEPLTLDIRPVNFTNSGIYSVSGQTSGIVNSKGGSKTLEASICLEECFETGDTPYQLDLIVTDDGSLGCSLPKQAAIRLNLVVEKGRGKVPFVSLSSPTRVFEVTEGDLISFDVTGSDADNDVVTLTAVGQGFPLASQSVSFKGASGAGWVVSSFSWQIDEKALKQPSYLIDFLVSSTSACGSVSKRLETIEVKPYRKSNLENNTIKADQTVCPGETPGGLTGSLPTGGSGSYYYTWEVSTTNEDKSFTLAPGNSHEQNYSPPVPIQTTWFRRKVHSGLNDELISTAVKITVREAVENNTIYSPQTICANTAPALLTGTEPSVPDGTFAYQWEYSTAGPDKGFEPVINANNGKDRDYKPGALSETTWFRRVVVASPCPPVPSNVIEITVAPTINWNTVSASQVVCAGSVPDKLSGPAAANSPAVYTYAWEYSTTSATEGFSPAPGLNTEAGYTAEQPQQATWFRRVVRSSHCQSISNAVLLTPEALPATPTATGTTVCPNQTATLQASTPTADTVIEWYDAPGGKLLHEGNAYQTDPLQQATDFYVRAISKNGCASPDWIKVTADVRPATADAGKDITIVEGKFVQLEATGGTSFNWSPAAGVSNPSIPNPFVRPQKTTTYTVTVTSEQGCVSTDEVTVRVLPLIAPPMPLR